MDIKLDINGGLESLKAHSRHLNQTEHCILWEVGAKQNSTTSSTR